MTIYVFIFRTKTRWFRLPLKTLEPRLRDAKRDLLEAKLGSALKYALKSISVVTSHIYKSIKGRRYDQIWTDMVDLTEVLCEQNSIDQRAQAIFTLTLFCSKKVFKSPFKLYCL